MQPRIKYIFKKLYKKIQEFYYQIVLINYQLNLLNFALQTNLIY